MEIIAVKGSMPVVIAGATIFQALISKLRRPLDSVDLEELPDSRERAGAAVLWLSCEGQMDVWDTFSDNSYLSAILGRQGLEVVAPIDLRTKKAESFSPQLIQGFWQKLEKNPKIILPSLTVETKRFMNEEVVWQEYHLCMNVAEHQILGGKTLPYFGTGIRKGLVVKKVQYHQKTTTAKGRSCVARNPSDFFTTSAIFCVHWS